MTSNFSIKVQEGTVNEAQMHFVRACIEQEMDDSSKSERERDTNVDRTFVESGKLAEMLDAFFAGVQGLGQVDAGQRCVVAIMPNGLAVARSAMLELYCQARIINQGELTEASDNLMRHACAQHQDKCRLLYAERVNDYTGDRIELHLDRPWSNLKGSTKLEEILFDL